ncbi:A/G-specific adenine glycosylase [Saccharicrinis sp. FJH62]|uniref:A/G-specific adenine glycosylase n=1 Tax=Saccharicrinis sp. FJH62 TaxID=3344657 RepID=UPI0035D46AB6
MTAFNKLRFSLQEWYQKNKRDLPWRQTSDPYKIWISEIILQQTQVKQGMDYYLRFVNQFPDVNTLANADEQDVLKLWQGLGYYSRARNLHFAAKQIAQKFNGIFPTDYRSVLSLKGVGEYTAAAIGSIAFNLPHAVLDGNVARVISRLFAISEPVNSTKGKKVLNELAGELLDLHEPGEHNQAMMEFGALYCIPKNPDCNRCTLNDCCEAFHKNLVDKLPVKENRIKQRTRYFLYLVYEYQEQTWITKRNGNDIWQGLYEFPLIETDNLEDETVLTTISNYAKKESENNEITFLSEMYKHILSHQVIFARFAVINDKFPKSDEDAVRIKKSEITGFPVSRLIERFLEDRNL